MSRGAGPSDKFAWGPGDFGLPQCWLCRHLSGDSRVAVCVAFPAGIPPEIPRNEADHRRPYFDPESGLPADTGVAGLHSITFDPRPDVPAEALAALVRMLDRLEPPQP